MQDIISNQQSAISNQQSAISNQVEPNFTGLTSSEIANAIPLTFKTSSSNSSGWDYTAGVYGSDSYALLHHIYKFQAKAGATYDILSLSYFDPYLLRIFDLNGTGIIQNSESDDPPDFDLGYGYYGVDLIWDWVAPYTGTYYVAASWNQGYYYNYYELGLWEDIDTIPSDTTAPYLISTSPSDGATKIDPAANIVLKFNETIQHGGGNIGIRTASGAVVVNYTAIISGDTLTINPAIDFEYGKQYYIDFSSGSIKDIAGNSYSGASSYDFTTIENTSNGKIIFGTSGSDILIGTEGIDTVIYNSKRVDSEVTKTDTGWKINSKIEGVDTHTKCGAAKVF